MIAAGNLGGPLSLLMMRTGLEIITVKLVEAAAGEPESLGRGFGFELTSAEASQYVTD